MNCKQFQDQIHEYVEGSLSPRGAKAADAHHSCCAECREALRNEQLMAGQLNATFRREADHLTLSPRAREASMEAFRPARPAAKPAFVQWLLRFGLPGFAVASVLVAGVWMVLFNLNNEPKGEAISIRPAAQSKPPVRIRVTYQVHCYTFRQEGNMVVDTLVPETNFVNVILWSEANLEIPRSRDKNMKL